MLKHKLKRGATWILQFVFQNPIVTGFKLIYEPGKTPRFGFLGDGTRVKQPFSCSRPGKIKIGNGCTIGQGSNFGILGNGNIILGDHVIITARCQIFSIEKVHISDHVLIASNVFICDCAHGYKDGNIPYNLQPLDSIGAISIGRGSWIGQNVIILPGVTIGEQCIIGANSVVRSSIPDRSIAVGAPAAVVKKWDDASKKWISA